jgi:uncharacterized membrane protein affecting hemolysin expression
MSYYTVLSPQTLLTGADPAQAAAQLLGLPGQTQGPQMNAGDLVTVADPPNTIAGYTQVTTTNGTVGWLPTKSIQQGVTGSTAMNVGIIAAIGVGVWFFFFRK